MPGRTPHDAFGAFIDPIKEAASCLGSVKITPSAGGRTEPGRVHAWTLNREVGVTFTGGWRFEAQMNYEMVQGAVSGIWKVRTHGYRYQLALHGNHLWRIHWHPTITSDYHLPHLHLPVGPPGEGTSETMKRHHPTGRMTFEDSVEWVFNAGITPARKDWHVVLRQSREVHVRHRSWSTFPPGLGG